jgi:NAD(P)-dependent dehydrogenase (short-subunit alcohol dehydrogenase family)
MLLDGKVVVVTGGLGLLGRAFVQAIVEHGGIAVAADIEAVSGHEWCNSINSDKAVFKEIDITSKESIESAIDGVQNQFGKIDAVVNNAYPRNKNYGKKFFDVEYSDFCENISMNLGGYFLVSQLFGKYFKEQGDGNIINIGSIYGVGAPKFEIYEGTDMTMPVEYSVIKSGVVHLTRYLAKYFKGKNIRVNCLSPGGVIAKQPDVFIKQYSEHCLTKGMLDPIDLVGSLLYLLSDMSQYMNGQNLVIDDGFLL